MIQNGYCQRFYTWKMLAGLTKSQVHPSSSKFRIVVILGSAIGIPNPLLSMAAVPCRHMSPTAGGTTAAGHLGPLESWNIKGPEIVETFLRNDSATMNPQPPLCWIKNSHVVVAGRGPTVHRVKEAPALSVDVKGPKVAKDAKAIPTAVNQQASTGVIEGRNVIMTCRRADIQTEVQPALGGGMEHPEVLEVTSGIPSTVHPELSCLRVPGANVCPAFTWSCATAADQVPCSTSHVKLPEVSESSLTIPSSV